MNRVIVALALALALMPAFADEPGLTPPSAPPAQSVPETEEAAEFVIVPAPIFALIEALIATQQREIERLRRAKTTEEGI